MPPDEHDRTAGGEWSASGSPADAVDVVAELIIEPPAAPAGAVVHAEMMFCRRCGETSYPVDRCCPWCNLWLVGEPPPVAPVHDGDDEPEDDWDTEVARRTEARRREPPPLVHPGVVIGVAYALLIGSLFLLLAMVVAQGVTKQEEIYGMLTVVEILDGVLTVTALSLVWRAARQKLPDGTRLLTWVAAVPVLFALLCLNITYITVLRELLRPFGAPPAEHIEVALATVMLICVQPALVEELFFRQMVLGVFRKWMNLHAAVWATAGLFAFAHITNPLGMPYLFLAGAAFGYARAFGGLSLAMVMHFVHNFAVIAYEAWK
jgi:membrane protease YdiL (CAAX protease family)